MDLLKRALCYLENAQPFKNIFIGQLSIKSYLHKRPTIISPQNFKQRYLQLYFVQGL